MSESASLLTAPSSELQELRLAYTAAYAAYTRCVQSVSDATERGVRPSDQAFRKEQIAFNELVNAREALFDVLKRHGKAPRI